LGDEVVLLAEQFARAAEAIKKHIRERGPATVSDLRQLLGTNRRVIVPLLERLDRDGVTLRQGDKRVLRADGPGSK
jgi:selenocysteine-specific elongation factor